MKRTFPTNPDFTVSSLTPPILLLLKRLLFRKKTPFVHFLFSPLQQFFPLYFSCSKKVLVVVFTPLRMEPVRLCFEWGLTNGQHMDFASVK